MTRLKRREFTRLLLSAGTALAFPQLLAAREFGHGRGVPWEPGAGNLPYHGTREARFLTAAERRTVAAITARLIPGDDNDPGAEEAGVVTFIDRQLAGFYGRGQHWYMKGPFGEALATQGFQSEHPPARLYRLALAELNAFCTTEHGAEFAELVPQVQDEILQGLDDEAIEFRDVSAKAFFDLLLENTIEGFFCDPIYGGNRGMVGWRYVGFPGARYDYRDFIHHDGARLELEPVGLAGRPGWSRAGKER